MSNPPSVLIPYPLPEQERLVVTSVGNLTAAQVANLTAPFKPDERVKGVATLQTFSVACDLTTFALPEGFPYRLKVVLWALGKASRYAETSYLPVPAKPLKSGLWRVLAGQAEGVDTVSVVLPAPAKVGRLHVTLFGLWDLERLERPPEPPAP